MMTDFSNEILPEEEATEQLLPTPEDAQEMRKADEIPKTIGTSPAQGLTGSGNAVLARQLGQRKVKNTDAIKPTKVAEMKTEQVESMSRKPPNPSLEQDSPPPELAAIPTPAPNTVAEPDPELKQQADPTAERQNRLALLTQTLSRLLKNPESAAIGALFNAYREASMEEQANAALAIANAILRIDADNRRRARIVLAGAMRAHHSHPLAQMLIVRLGSWVSGPSAPPPQPEPGDGE